MTVWDLLFIALFVSCLVALTFAAVSAFRGRRALAFKILRALGVSAAVYVGIVYVATASSKPDVLRVGDF
jgi:hypothetical protein